MSHPVPADAVSVIDLWPDGVPEGPTRGLAEKTCANPDPMVPERWVRNVTQPTLTQFAAKGGDGRAMLVVPGGGFRFVSIDNEGYDLARALAAVGWEVFVLKYRVAPMPDDDADVQRWLDEDFAGPQAKPGQTTPPVSTMLDEGRDAGSEDAREAMRLLLERADVLGIDPERIAAIGFSAGGGIVTDLAYDSPQALRPYLVAPIYPAWREGLDVPGDAPPTFLAAASDDPLVAPMSTARLAEAVHRAGVPVALHIYGNGGHGFGIRRQGNLSDRWFDDFLRWLAVFG